MRVRTIPKKTPPKITVAMTEEMLQALEEERKVRKIATVPEVVRIIVSDYFKTKSEN
jgi:hypothetical protein